MDGVTKPHRGLDICTGVKTGFEVNAAAAGKVAFIGWENTNNHKQGYGYYMIIDHGNGYYSYYGHLEEGKEKIKVGDKITNGQVIALSGNTGHSTGPHLHLGFMGPDGNFFDPEEIDDLQKFIDNGYQLKDNRENPIPLSEVLVTAEDPRKELEKRINDMLWDVAIKNEFGNSGRYNKPGRTTDQNYSDEFLKWYYTDHKKDEKK
jgi:murein DD-endopeptidase MepM/ murein hydrolase activator NlpD